MSPAQLDQRRCDRPDHACGASLVHEIIDRYGGNPEMLIPMMQDIQTAEGYLPKEHLRTLAQELGVPLSRIYGVATFYASFRLQPKGEHTITLCMGTVCYLKGADKISAVIQEEFQVTPGGTSPDGKFSFAPVNCLGACALAPVMVVDGEYFGGLSATSARDMLHKIAAGKQVVRANAKPAQSSGEKTVSVMTARLENAGDLAEYCAQLLAERSAPRPGVRVCIGTGCTAKGARQVLARFQESAAAEHGGVTVETKCTGCHGFCERGPIVVVDPGNVFYQGVKPEDVPEIIVETALGGRLVERLLYQDGMPKPARSPDEIPFYQAQQRIVLAHNGVVDPTSIDDYIAAGGYAALAKVLAAMTPEAVIEEITRSGLRGRGGGGFLTGRKWRTARDTHGEPKYVIANGDEGDPGAFMDRSLMEGSPHSVLEGMIVGAYAIGSSQGYIYVRHEYPLAVEHLAMAMEAARELGLLGENILGSGFNFDIRINRGGGAFICGESTALMVSLEGRVGEPRAKYIHTVEAGFHGKPSLLNNVETWANVPPIILRGADWFASLGTAKSKGTKVFSLVGKVKNTGLVEVPMGMTLRQIIYQIGGGIRGDKPFKAVQTGGPSGGCIPAAHLDEPVDFDRLTELGSMMGSGGMIVMDADTCMVNIARYFLRFLKDESCGKCTPCREGIAQMLHILDGIAGGKGQPGDIERLEELAVLLEDTALCALGKTAANPVLSTLRYFRDEYRTHIEEKHCPAKECRGLFRYKIETEACTGCGVCRKKCPVEAIAGEKKQPHLIDWDKCTSCGACFDVCRFGAVKKV